MAEPQETAAQESLQLLLEACLLLSSKTELSDVLRSIMRLSSRVVKAETASLLLLDPKTQELYFDVALGLDPQTSKTRLKMGQSIAGSVAQDGKPAIINDVKSDPRWNSSVDRQSGFSTRSILAAPMEIQGRLVGVVEAINHHDGPFSFADLRIFEAFAAQAAVAIENARLFASLREEKTKLSTVFARMNDAAVLIDERGAVVLANEAARKFFAVGAEAPLSIDATLAALQVSPALPEILKSDRSVIEFEASREKPKKFILAGTASALRFEGTESVPGWNGRLFVFRDVTEERREGLLKRTFLSLISHKLKTPLASITGYTQILSEELAGKSPPMIEKSLNTVLVQGRKLTELVDKLLRFTTLESMDTSAFALKPFKIDDVISETVQSMHAWLAEQHGTVLAEAGCGAVVLGDAALVRDALKNLIENGIKFNPKPEKKVAVWADSRDGWVTVYVKDQGPGIAPEEQDKIFKTFYQVETSFTGQVEGWGLGLPFVKKIAEHHGGNIHVDSRPNDGTTVSFTLPVPREH